MALYFRLSSLPELQGLSPSDRGALLRRVRIPGWQVAFLILAVVVALLTGEYVSAIAAAHGHKGPVIVAVGALTTGVVAYVYVAFQLNMFVRKWLRNARSAA
jgi:hypothetical protein